VTLEARVQNALRTHAAPAMDLDGSEIDVLEVFDDIATVRLGTICASCPGKLTAVVAGLEQELKKHVPEIEMLEIVL